jgi:phosphate uptake regulator
MVPGHRFGHQEHRRVASGFSWPDDRFRILPKLYRLRLSAVSLVTGLIGELATVLMTLPVAMELTLVGRFYARLGDHAVSIARRVIYLAGSAQQ